MDIFLPGTSEEFNQLFNQSYDNGKPSYYRLSEYENKKSYNVELGRANLIKKGKDATIICVGNMLQKVIDATENMDVTILYYTSINPFDSELLIENFNTNIIVVEPYYEGGLNYKINKSLEGKKYFLYNIGVPIDYLTNYGTKNEHDKELGLDSNGIKEKIKKCIL